MHRTLEAVLLKYGLPPANAELSARLFSETSRDGVYTHGVHRFESYVENIRNGSIIADAVCRQVSAGGALERWDGQRGPGNVNAYHSMERAVEIAQQHGLGMVALANTNHWLRGGTYGWQAAERGVMAILWTNTIGLLPPWGSQTPVLGNNPLIFAVPRSAGHVVLDFAQSQYSFGTLEQYRRRGEQLPWAGGFDGNGRLTTDPTAILESVRPLPIGLWKGSGLALLLDMFAALLSGGRSTADISHDGVERAVSQVFIAISPDHQLYSAERDRVLDAIITHAKSAGSEVRYPGERVLKDRAHNQRHGIPVETDIWQRILAL